MKLIKSIVAISAILALSGCASQGGVNGVAENIGNGLKGVAEGIGGIAGSAFQPYTNGVEVTEQQMAQLEVGMSPAEVEQIVGLPPSISEIGGNEMWSYPYTEITHFSGNRSETTVIRFDDNGRLARAYKTNSRTSSTGNALVDAANGVETPNNAASNFQQVSETTQNPTKK